MDLGVVLILILIKSLIVILIVIGILCKSEFSHLRSHAIFILILIPTVILIYAPSYHPNACLHLNPYRI